MSLYDKSSLIQVPSLYKDGTLVSTIPEDRSGDFTFSRGSNISATRVNANGNIEKGYENLLLQSNSFTTTWLQTDLTATSGQSGYDGSNDAWLLNKSAANGRLRQYVTDTGIQTLSAYFKAGTNNWMRITYGGATTYFDLANGVLGSDNSIDATITSIESGWYRCTFTANVTSAQYAQFYVADANGDTSGTTGSIYIQDAMLNQGMVAYPYVETTTAPVAGGILEDMPRIDFSGGNQSLLLEPSRTQLVSYSEYANGFNIVGTGTATDNAETSPEGLQNAFELNDTSSSAYYRIEEFISVSAGNHTMSVFVKKTTGTPTRYPAIQLDSARDYVILNTTTGAYNETGGTDNDSVEIEDWNSDWWRVIITNTLTSGSKRIAIWPALSSNGTGSSPTPTGSNVFYGVQLEQGSYPTSYIPTYGVSQTRLADVYGGNDISSFVGDNQGTLFVEWEENPFLNTDGYVTSIGLFQLSGADKIYISGRSTLLRLTSDIHINIIYTFSASGSLKIAFKYNGSEVILFVNGVEAGRETQNDTFNPTSFGNSSTSITAGVQENINQILYFPTALSDEECIALTTIS